MALCLFSEQRKKKSVGCDDDDYVRHQLRTPANVPLVIYAELTSQYQDNFSNRLPYVFVRPFSFLCSIKSTTDELDFMCGTLNQWNVY